MTPTSQPGLLAIERNETLTERVVAQLRKALTDGVFVPGQLIKIRDVARALNVSPTPAREALTILIAEGVLLTAETNKSAMVPPLTAESLNEITELRVALECVAAAAALPNLTDEDIAALAKAHAELRRATKEDDIKTTLENNSAFHYSIYGRSGMPLLVKMIETVWLRSGAYLRTAYPAYGRLRKGLDNHDKIIRSLKKRDVAALCAAIESDIRESSEHLFAQLEPHFAADGGRGVSLKEG
jgi:DNA-binding GntR family transcriptional regulator